mgnify:CR=1 FL=1
MGERTNPAVQTASMAFPYTSVGQDQASAFLAAGVSSLCRGVITEHEYGKGGEKWGWIEHI